VVAVLNVIYEEGFLGFSYGFRPKRGQHDALDALVVGITTKKVNFILDVDIRSYFESVNQGRAPDSSSVTAPNARTVAKCCVPSPISWRRHIGTSCRATTGIKKSAHS
jgi:hypothetical protein